MYLVTGASGHFGRLAIDSLIADHGIVPASIIATTRTPANLADLAARGVSVRAADFGDAASLDKAFAGAERLLLVSTDALGVPGLRLSQHRAAVAAAARAGVRHLVYTSMPKPETSAVLFAPDHLGTEQAIAASSIPAWTVLRNNWYFENLLMGLPHAISTGQWFSAAGDGKIAHAARADLARAAAAALAASPQDKSVRTLTGSEEWTTAEIAALAARLTGKPLTIVPVSDDGLAQGLIGAGLPDPVARVVASFDTNIRQGGLDGVTGDIKSLTGKAPHRFEDWFAANLAAFRG